MCLPELKQFSTQGWIVFKLDSLRVSRRILKEQSKQKIYLKVNLYIHNKKFLDSYS